MFKPRFNSLLALAAALVLSAIAVSACTLPDALPQALQAAAALAGAGLSPDLTGQGFSLAVAAAAMKPAKTMPAEPMKTTPIEPFEAAARAADAAADAALNQAALAQAGTDRTAGELPTMTLAEAAALVRRRKVLSAPGAQPRVIDEPISPDEVLAFKDHGTHVVVVTIDGQKFSSADAA